MPAERLHWREVRDTSTFRLTLMLGAAASTGLLALVTTVYLLTSWELTARTDTILRAQLARLIDASPADLPAQIRAEIDRSNGFSHFALISGNGEIVAGDLRALPALVPGQPVERNDASASLRLVAARTATGETIVAARDISQLRYLRGRLRLISIGSGVAMLAGIAAAAFLLALAPLRRVRDLERAAAEIARGSLDRRMPILGRGDELDRFACTVNRMVDEIGRVMAQVKGVTESVAHDLRTPLGRVRSQLLAIARLPEAQAAAEQAIADLDGVLERFAALLRIAEIEAGARRAQFADVELGALLAEVVDLYEPLAEERGVSLHLRIASSRPIVGDRHLLLEAISNLLDNAVKFARCEVTAELRANAAETAIVISDDGPGIPEGEREAVLGRFHRGVHAAGVPGTGLGLSIVAAVAHLHGLDLRLENGMEGLCASLRSTKQVTGSSLA